MQRQDIINATFLTSSVDSTSVGEKLYGQTVEDGDGEDGPVVFICGKCKLPVGDSMSWDGSEDGQNQIRLKRESEFIVEKKNSGRINWAVYCCILFVASVVYSGVGILCRKLPT